MLNYRIRKMWLDDIPQVIAIDQASFSLPWPERSFRFELTQNEISRCWVCEAVENDIPVAIAGMMVIWLIVDEAHIATIAIHPDFRRKLLGKRLLATGLLAAYREGARVSYLEVRAGNLAAQNLYREFGYVEVGIRPRYYKDNFEDAVLMTLPKIQPKYLEQVVDGSDLNAY